MGQRWLTGDGQVAPAGIRAGVGAAAKWQAELRATDTARAPWVFRECNPGDPDSCDDPLKFCDRAGQCRCRTNVKQGLGKSCASCPGSCGPGLACNGKVCVQQAGSGSGGAKDEAKRGVPGGPYGATGTPAGTSWKPPQFNSDEQVGGKCNCCYWKQYPTGNKVPHPEGKGWIPEYAWHQECTDNAQFVVTAEQCIVEAAEVKGSNAYRTCLKG